MRRALLLLPLAAAPPAAGPAPAASPRPVILSVDYGRAPAPRRGHELRIRARDRDGQIVGVTAEVAPRGPVVHADGFCNLGGARNGRARTYRLPVRRLARGRHRVTVEVTSSTCAAEPRVQSAGGTFTVTAG